jgi:hypothetical protein
MAVSQKPPYAVRREADIENEQSAPARDRDTLPVDRKNSLSVERTVDRFVKYAISTVYRFFLFKSSYVS